MVVDGILLKAISGECKKMGKTLPSPAFGMVESINSGPPHSYRSENEWSLCQEEKIDKRQHRINECGIHERSRTGISWQSLFDCRGNYFEGAKDRTIFLSLID